MTDALILEDDAASRDALVELLERAGFEVRSAGTLEAAREHLEGWSPDVAILDIDLPDGSGTELMGELDEDDQTTEVIFVTGNASVETAIAALRGGAVDYLTKPVDTRRLRRTLERIKRAARLRNQVTSLRSELKAMGRFGPLVGASDAMREVYEKIERVAPTKATVTIIGETGVGKELVARAIHEMSSRSAEPFVAVNCGALPENLIESELFGSEKGAFTGADKQRLGVFERADGGTLFLDEVIEMPTELQVKLLRTLELREVTRVGGSGVIKVNVRIVAATNRDPMGAVEQGELREDLLHRLLVFPIVIPPLRQREGDVKILSRFFLDRLNENAEEPKVFSSDALDGLTAESWKGNVRQLRNVIERGYIMADHEIGAKDLFIEDGLLEPAPDEELPLEVGMSIAQAERRLIEATLEEFDGDKKRAAETLGISLKTLYNRLRTYRGV